MASPSNRPGVVTHVLTDADQNLRTETWRLDGGSLQVGTDITWSVTKRTLHGGLQEGVECIDVDNGALSFRILPTRGMGLLSGRCGDIRLGWDSPVKDPVHPAFVDLNDRGGLGWLRGFNEWICRCGLESNGSPGPDVIVDNNGNEAEVQLTVHGKVANTPARTVSVSVDPGEPVTLSVTGVLDETMMFGPALRLTSTVSTVLGSKEITIADRVTNLKRQPAEMQLLYHCNYGSPLLENGSRLLAPFTRVAPRDARAEEGVDRFDRFAKPQPGFVEQVYFYELVGKRRTGETVVLLKNAKGDAGSSLRFSLKQLPCFTLWKNTAARNDGYVTGLEPATNYPNAKRFERTYGRVVMLAGGASWEGELRVAVHDSRKAVREIESEIKKLQSTVRPKVSEEVVAGMAPE